MFLFSSHEREATCPKWTLAFKFLHFPFHHWTSLSQCLSLRPNGTSSGRASLTTLMHATLPAVSLPCPAHYSGLLSREQASLFKRIYLLSYSLSCLLDLVSSSPTSTQAPWDQKVVLFNSHNVSFQWTAGPLAFDSAPPLFTVTRLPVPTVMLPSPGAQGRLT